MYEDEYIIMLVKAMTKTKEVAETPELPVKEWEVDRVLEILAANFQAELTEHIKKHLTKEDKCVMIKT